MRIQQTSRRASGFSLIEILVALFVFAIGILTVAGLQIVSKRTNFDAVQRTSATYLAYDIIERMRANPGQLAVYVDDVLGEDRPVPAVDCRAAACTPTQLADFDVWQWQQAIDGVAEQSVVGGVAANTGGLVNPTGCIAGIAAGGQGVYTVTVAWEGTTELDSFNDDNTCGTGKYGANNEFRRLIEITTYVAP